MSTIVLPDVVTSCRSLLRGEATLVYAPVATYITELRTYYITSNGWIDTYIPNPEQLPRNAIRVQSAGGLGPYGDLPGYEHQRVQFDCYGATQALASKIATLLKLILMPPDRNMQGWLAEGTRVVNTLSLTGPLPGVEPNTDPAAHFRTITAEFRTLQKGQA